jgi:hypothetical protein
MPERFDVVPASFTFSHPLVTVVPVKVVQLSDTIPAADEQVEKTVVVIIGPAGSHIPTPVTIRTADINADKPAVPHILMQKNPPVIPRQE